MESIDRHANTPGANPGQKDSPFANSPYQSPWQTAPAGGEPPHPVSDTTGDTAALSQGDSTPTGEESVPETPVTQAPPKQEQPAPKKPSGSPLWKKLLAAAAAIGLVIGSCAVTAGVVNHRWEEETARMESDFEREMEQLRVQMETQRGQLQAAGSTGSDVLTPGLSGYLTPAQVYARNVNSVVSVSKYSTSSGWGGISGEMLTGTGSGFIITDDGYVMTNYHVIEGGSRITITTFLGDEYDAKVVGYDSMNDVALLKVEAQGLTSVNVGSSDDLVVGDMVVAIGNPLGDELASTMTVGYVSGKDRSISTDGTIINMLQTDAAINSGNSGGPLFNMKGEVIGITSAKYSGSSSSGASIEGIGFAIPINDVMGMIDDFMNYGYLRNQAYLGVSVMDMDASTARMYSLPTGSYVQEVVEGGSAHRAGVLPQDIIIAIGEYSISGNSSLTTTLRRFSAGDTTTITVYRAGAEITLDITFDERPQDLNAQSTQPLDPGEMPDTGSYDEWYEYFSRYFGSQGNQP